MARAPSLRRRLAAFVYEGVILFGVVMIGGYLYAALTQQRHALIGRTGLMLLLFLLLGVYFVWFWTHGGQTVAMKTWHIRLTDVQGRPLSQVHAFARYVCTYLWFMPALVVAYASGLTASAPAVFTLLAVGVLVYALLARTNAERQFVHDMLCRTRLVDTRVPITPRA